MKTKKEKLSCVDCVYIIPSNYFEKMECRECRQKDKHKKITPKK